MSDTLRGIIIYAPEDVDKNRKFIRMCTEILDEKGIELQLVVLKDKNQADILESLELGTKQIDFAINRSRNEIIAGNLELHGVRVFNSSKVTKICNDKWETYLYANKLGINVMKTCKETGNELITSYPKVVKSCSGHGGSEVFLVHDEHEEKVAIGQIEGDYIIQELADAKGCDIRAYVIGGRIVTAMRRSSENGFKSNYSQGGVAEEYNLNNEEIGMITTITKDLCPDYAGIDFFYDGRRLVLNEIEDAVGARMVYENTQIDIVREYIEYIVDELLKNSI